MVRWLALLGALAVAGAADDGRPPEWDDEEDGPWEPVPWEPVWWTKAGEQGVRFIERYDETEPDMVYRSNGFRRAKPRRRRARARRGANRRYKILEPGKTGLQAYGPLTECRILGEGWTSEEYPRGQPILWEKNKKKPLKVVAKNVMPCWEEAMNWMEIGRARRAARRATDAGPEAPRAPGPRGRSSARPSWATRRRRSPACRRTASSSSASRSPSARRRARSPPAAASSSAVP